MAKVLITGGCGFIGSAVVDCMLKKGFEVYIIDNLSLGKNHWSGDVKKPTLFKKNILDFDSCEKIFADVIPDTVIHLAAHHYIPFCEKNVYEAYQLNVAGTLNILECCSRFGVSKILAASSGDVYTPNTVPHKEDDTVKPIYVYGHTKYLMEQVCERYCETKLTDTAFIIARLFNAAGPRETNPHFLPDMVKQIVNGKRKLEVGNLWPKRDFVDVNSMAEIISDVVFNVTGMEIVNIGSGIVQEVGQVLNTLVSVLPFKVDIVSVLGRQRSNDRPYLCPNVTKLKEFVGRAASSFSVDTAREIFREFIQV